ncbi:glycoside hydrolase family 2 protein [Flagelloscypha sp. PMI_526]|nr:glycoside hydrolase family 2 protein [Flagelloscypha sp. PMI_526]
MSNILTSRSIDTNWSFAQIDDTGNPIEAGWGWLPTSTFPTTAHVELLKLGKIPDPYANGKMFSGVGEASWAFKTEFEVSEEELKKPFADLVFDGLDTFATAFLNGKMLLWNGDSSRLHVRKAGYNYGWDWGPILMTTGPWKPIKLNFYSNGIDEVHPESEVSEALAVKISVAVKTLADTEELTANVTITDPEGEVKASSVNLPVNAGKVEAVFDWEAGKIDLWWPVGYGNQPLYTLDVELNDSSGIIDSRSQKISFRRARIVEDKLVDQEGYTFLFEINNVRIFCGGDCPESRYRAWLELLVAGNQNMIRVWGGGIYEYDFFYDICDVLVWQDFMFGCGQYPAYDSFLESVEEEAIQAVKRLRHHPSLVIWDYQIAESYDLELDYSDETSDFRKTNFPARHIYERLLPKVVSDNCNIHYHRSSPYSGHGKKSSDKQHGDLHQWNVWHGTQEPWHNWDILAGRFVSEFGMEAYPNIRTAEGWLGEGPDAADNRYPQSRFTVNHNKADGFERRLELYLMENFKHAFDLPSYVYYTQIMQAETIGAAYRLWRRNWKGRGREYTAGALVWQLNDCWPVTSWAICDYYLRPKPAYFAIARELRQWTVGMTRKEYTKYENDRTAAFYKIETVLEIWGTNSTLTDKEVTLEVTFFDLHNPEWKESFSKEVTLAPNSSTELFKGSLPGVPLRTNKSEIPPVIIASARLLNESGRVLARYSNWPEPFKYIKFPGPDEVGLKIEVESDGETVVLSSRKPIKGLVLDVEGPDAQWSDQAIDLMPGDPQSIHVSGLEGRKIEARYLGDGTA